MIIKEKLVKQFIFEGFISLKECVLMFLKLMINKTQFWLWVSCLNKPYKRSLEVETYHTRNMKIYMEWAIQFQWAKAKIVNALKTVDDTKKLTWFFNSAPPKT